MAVVSRSFVSKILPSTIAVVLSIGLMGASKCDSQEDTPEAALTDVIRAAQEDRPGYLAHRLSGDARRRFQNPAREAWLRQLILAHEFVPVKGARIDVPARGEKPGKPWRTRYWYRIKGKRNGTVHELGSALVNCEEPKKKPDRYLQCYLVEIRPKSCRDRFETAESMAQEAVTAALRDDFDTFMAMLADYRWPESAVEMMRKIRESLDHELVVVDEHSPLSANFRDFHPRINVYQRIEGSERFRRKFTLDFSCDEEDSEARGPTDREELCRSRCVLRELSGLDGAPSRH